jgi:hypothetical protein
VSHPVVIWEREDSIGLGIAAALFFLAVGFICAVKPHLIRREALRLYTPPFAEPGSRYLPFLEGWVYRVVLRMIGIASLGVGLFLAAILLGSAEQEPDQTPPRLESAAVSPSGWGSEGVL